MFFLVKYSKSLEEGSFRNRAADFLWMLLFGAAILVGGREAAKMWPGCVVPGLWCGGLAERSQPAPCRVG